MSDFFNVSSGLKQGCLLSPLLFSLFINNMVRKVNALGKGVPLGPYEQISILLYADDIALIAESEENLQDMLDLLGAWCQEWGLKVYPKKTEIIHFRNPSVPKSPFQFTCGNLELRVVIKYRYLGIWFNEHLSRIQLQGWLNLLIEHLVFSSQSLSSVEGCLLTVLLPYMNL